MKRRIVRIIMWDMISVLSILAVYVGTLYFLKDTKFFLLSAIIPFIILAPLLMRAENIVKHEKRMLRRERRNAS